MFVSEYFGLDDELDRIEVFDCVLNNDSRFFINLMRLNVSDVPEFKGAYQRMILRRISLSRRSLTARRFAIQKHRMASCS